MGKEERKCPPGLPAVTLLAACCPSVLAQALEVWAGGDVQGPRSLPLPSSPPKADPRRALSDWSLCPLSPGAQVQPRGHLAGGQEQCPD